MGQALTCRELRRTWDEWFPEEEEAAGARPGSVSAMRNKFEAKKSGGGSAARRPVSTGGAKKLRTASTAERCAACGTAVYAADRTADSAGAAYHRACLKCSQCHTALQATPFERVEGKFYCNAPANPQSCYRKLTVDTSGAVKGAVAGEKRRASHAGDVSGVIETIGAELEAAMEGMIPRCEICGSRFAAAQAVSIVGPLKYHTDCFNSGEPVHAAESDLTVARAARQLPTALTLRFTANGKGFTYFFVRLLDPEDEEESGGGGDVVDVLFTPDPASHAPNERTCPAAAGGGPPEFALEVVDDSGACGRFDAPSQVEVSDGLVVARLDQERFGLRFQVTGRWTYDAVASKIAAVEVEYRVRGQA